MGKNQNQIYEAKLKSLRLILKKTLKTFLNGDLMVHQQNKLKDISLIVI
jgi:hypothetical protein